MTEDRKDEFWGQHVYVRHRLYTHHGIGDGRGGVIHYSGLANGRKSGPVLRTPISEFAQGRPVRVRTYRDRRYPPDEAVRRAEERVGEDRYSVVWNNCEHFSEWCITGRSRSRQVRAVVRAAWLVLTPAVWYTAARLGARRRA